MEMQQIYCFIDPGGNQISGQGFKVQKLREGLYAIEFERAFADPPAITCTIFGGEWETFNKSIAVLESQPNYAILSTSSPDRPEACGFTFIATGKV